MQKMYEYADMGNTYGILLTEVKTCMWTFIKKRAQYLLKKWDGFNFFFFLKRPKVKYHALKQIGLNTENWQIQDWFKRCHTWIGLDTSLEGCPEIQLCKPLSLISRPKGADQAK